MRERIEDSVKSAIPGHFHCPKCGREDLVFCMAVWVTDCYGVSTLTRWCKRCVRENSDEN